MEEISLGAFLRNRRERVGKSLRSFAAELNIAAPYLHDIEKDNRTPSDRLLPALIEGLSLSKQDEILLYDLIGQRRQGLYPDLSSYIQNTDLSPSFSQAVAGDLALHAHCHYRCVDDSPSLYPTDGLAFLVVTDKNKIATPVWKVQAQRLENLFV